MEATREEVILGVATDSLSGTQAARRRIRDKSKERKKC
jgi:hypothetical protein